MNIVKDSDQNSFVSIKTCILPRVNIIASAPVKGSIAYDTSTGLLYYGNGDSWVQIQSGDF